MTIALMSSLAMTPSKLSAFVFPKSREFLQGAVYSLENWLNLPAFSGTKFKLQNERQFSVEFAFFILQFSFFIEI
jgi:hypothetical protein